MKEKKYKRLIAFALSLAMFSGNFLGIESVKAIDLEYVFKGNMVLNSSFDTKDQGWVFENGEYANNNGHNGKGDNHFFLKNQSSKVSQQVRAPYTGYYKTGLWVAMAGNGGKFGIKNFTTGEMQEINLATNTKYSEYNHEVWMNKGDIAEVWVTGSSQWVNGDDISIEYDISRFENMVINPQFTTNNAWEKYGNVQIADGKAILNEVADGISQKLYLPLDGAYYAEVTLENAEGAVVTFAGEKSETVDGSKSVRVEAEGLKTADEVELKITGKAEVTNTEVRFDLEKLPNTAPEALEVAVKGECTADLTLEGTYQFTDADQHVEGNSKYQWLIADERDGEYQVLENENNKNLVVKSEWEDKYLKFQVTPVDQYAKEGTSVMSEAIGPVDINIIKNPSFESNGENWSGIKIRNIEAYDGLNQGYLNKDGTATQDIIIPRTAYYDFMAYTHYDDGTDSGKIYIEDEAGNVLGETFVESGKEWTANEISDIALEKGQKIKVVLKGAKDVAVYFDKLSMKRDREAGMPTYKNVVSLKTNPEAVETVVNRETKTIQLKYIYGTDLTKVTVTEFVISEGAQANLKIGDQLDLSKEKTFTLIGADGSQDEWGLQAEVKEKKVTLESSNEYLMDTFNWAANKMNQFVMTGKTGPINVWKNHDEGTEAEYIPSYWAGYYDRTAFYTRDFVHQATGGQIAGLADENYSMFEAFAKECTEARKWYTVWALNFDGSVFKCDYRNDNNFVREVPAQFELVEKAYKQYLWSGDERYILDDTLWNFYTNVMTKYVESHDANKNGVVQEVGTGIFSGSCTYNERGGRQVIEAGDAIGSQYQATLAYAGMLKARGQEREAEQWYQKAADLKRYFNEEWSMTDNMESGYVCAWGPNGEKYSDFSKETSWFMPMKLITEPGERNDQYIDFILANLGNGIGDPNVDTEPNNIEAYTYIPDMLFPYNRSNEAWKWMKYITSIKDKPHERPEQGTNGDYPEISFTFVSHTVEGMMGVEPNARENFVATSPRLPEEVPDVTAKYMRIGDYELDLTHTGNTASVLTNTVGDDLTWEVRFYGEHPYIQIGDEYVKAEQKELNGEVISYVTTTVKTGETVNAKVASQTDVADLQAAEAVDEKIATIGNVTLGSEVAITEARTAYDALSETAKARVQNLSVLEAAEAKLAALKSEAEESVKRAEAVEKFIADLGDITLDDKEAVQKARAAYNNLSDAEKAMVSNLSVLEEAEDIIAELEEENQKPDGGDENDGQKPDGGDENNGQKPDGGDENDGQKPDGGDENNGQKPDGGDGNDDQKPDGGDGNDNQKPNDTDKNESIKTGDNGNVIVWGITVGAALLGIIGAIFAMIRRKTK